MWAEMISTKCVLPINILVLDLHGLSSCVPAGHVSAEFVRKNLEKLVTKQARKNEVQQVRTKVGEAGTGDGSAACWGGKTSLSPCPSHHFPSMEDSKNACVVGVP